MPPDLSEEKKLVYEYWNKNPCGSDLSSVAPYTKEYFDELEKIRYGRNREGYIWEFAQFAKYHGKKVLEIGIGVGTDFIQWVRSGCVATGCDLTPAAVEYTKKRLECYGLSAGVLQEDCEKLSFPEQTFDLVYSFGVIHHTPEPQKAISEIYRVLKRGGTAKIMLYHRYSGPVFRYWINHALLKRDPFRSIDEIVAKYNSESPDTKIYSKKQARALFEQFSRVNLYIQLTPWDYTDTPRLLLSRKLTNAFVRGLGNHYGWNLMITAEK